MASPAAPGRIVYAIAVAALGAVSLATRLPLHGIEPLDPNGASAAAWGLATGVTLVALALGLLAGRTRRAAALGLVGVFVLWILAPHVPALVAKPAFGSGWITAIETLVLACAAWLVAVRAGALGGAGDAHASARSVDVAIALFGASFLVFGASHFVFRAYVESVIPAWIPAPRFWAYATGVAHLAAGASLLTRVLAPLAASLLAVMFASWVVVLHAPRVAAAGESRFEWTSLFIALACSGASAIVAGVLAERPYAPGDASPEASPETSRAAPRLSPRPAARSASRRPT